MSRLPNLDDLSFDAVIPSILLINDKIEPNAIKLYAFVRGLTKAHGYCYASNEYLAACMKCDESTVRRLLKSLEDEGFISKKWQDSDGKRHIFLGAGLKKPLEGGVLKFERGGAQNQAGGCSKSSTRYMDSVSDVNITDREGPTPPESPPVSPENHFKDKFDGCVKISEKNYQRLLEKFRDEARINDYAERLYRWSFDNPKDFKKKTRHDMTIESWMIKDGCKVYTESKAQFAITPPCTPQPRVLSEREKQTNADGELGEKICKKFKKLIMSDTVELRPDGFVFDLPRGEKTSAFFGQPGFKEICISCLRKLEQDVSDL